MFGFGRSTQPDTWIDLVSIDQLKDAIETSDNKIVILFKHSTRCSISSMVRSGIIKDYNLDADKVDFYHLDLLVHRNISNEIATLTGVFHQSPQLIVLKNQKVVHHASHSAINIREVASII